MHASRYIAHFKLISNVGGWKVHLFKYIECLYARNIDLHYLVSLYLFLLMIRKRCLFTNFACQYQCSWLNHEYQCIIINREFDEDSYLIVIRLKNLLCSGALAGAHASGFANVLTAHLLENSRDKSKSLLIYLNYRVWLISIYSASSSLIGM